MSEIATAFVRIRPNTAGFRQETETGVKGALSGVGKLLAGTLALGVGFEIGKNLVEGASSLQKSVETIHAQFGKAGDEVVRFGENSAKSLGLSSEVATRTAARFGILFNNIGVGRDQAAQMTIGFEQLAGSIAAIRGVDPATVLQNLPLAAAGNVRSLKQLGIAIDQTQLKQIAFNLGLTATAKTALTPAQRAITIYTVATQKLPQYLAQAAAHSGDLANVQRRLSAEWSNAKDALGSGLLPPLAKLGSYLGDTLPGAISGVRSDFKQFGSALETVTAPIGGVVALLKDMLLGFVALKAVSFTEGIITGVQALTGRLTAFIAKAAAAGGATTAAAAGNAEVGSTAATAAPEVTALTVAIEELTASLAEADIGLSTLAVTTNEVAAASDRFIAVSNVEAATLRLTGAAAATSAAEIEAATVATEAASFSIGGFAAGLIAMINPVTAIAAGLVATAGALIYFSTRESAAAAANDHLRSSLNQLSDALNAVPSDKVALAQANLSVKQDQAALSATKLKASSFGYQQLVINLTRDLVNQRQAQQTLRDQVAKTAQAYTDAKNRVNGLVSAVVEASLVTGRSNALRGPATHQNLTGDRAAAAAREAATKFADSLQSDLDKQKNLSPIIRHNEELLLQFATVLGRLPTRKEIRLSLTNTDANLTFDNLRRRIRGLPEETAADSQAAAAGISNEFQNALASSVAKLGLADAVNQQFALLPGLVDSAAATAGLTIGQQFAKYVLDPIKAALALPGQILAEATKQFNLSNASLVQSIANSKLAIQNLQQQIATEITQEGRDIYDAVNQAKTNLSSIMGTFESDLGQVIDAPLNRLQNKLNLQQNKISLESLRRQVVLPGGKSLSADPNAALAQLQALSKNANAVTRPAIQSFLLQYQQAVLGVQQSQATITKDHINITLGNLVSAFNNGKLNATQFTKGLRQELRKEGINMKAVGQLLGGDFEDGFKGTIKGLLLQAQALQQSPKVAGVGAGQLPTVDHPLWVLQNDQRQIAKDTKDLVNKQHQLQTKQYKESQKLGVLANQVIANGTVKTTPQRAPKKTTAADRNPGHSSTNSKNLNGAG